jgi:outer membrane lipoprotein-sorting protein
MKRRIVMNKRITMDKRVDISNMNKLSAFIDSLNDERKPTVKADSAELDRLFDTVRKVKSLKPPVMPDENFQRRIVQNLSQKATQPVKNRRRPRRHWVAGFAGIAAILVIALLLNIVGLVRNSYVVYAMEQVYNNVKAYHGTLEVIFSNEAGEKQTQSVLDVWVDKSGNYYIGVLEGSYKGLITVSNGEKVWQFSTDENMMNVLPVFSETYEFIFELGNEIDALKNAESSRIIGDDDIAGRPAYIMEVTPEGGLPYKLWVDKETKIPLQKQGSMYRAIQYTTKYTEISFEESIPEELLTVDPDKGFKEADFAGDKHESNSADNTGKYADNAGNPANNTGTTADKPDDSSGNIDLNNGAVKFTPEFKVDVDMEIEKAEQIAADSGSSPWKLDPVYVAQVFVSLQISPGGIVGDYPVDYDDLVIAEDHGNSIKIGVNSDRTDIKVVYLERLIRQDDTGIWTVTGYDVSP